MLFSILNPVALRMAKTETLLHSEWPKLQRVMAVQSAIELDQI